MATELELGTSESTQKNRYHGAVTFRAPEPDLPSWTFLSNHTHVLVAISRDPELRQRDISYMVGITTGAVQRILHELEAGGYIQTERVGRRNRYILNTDLPLRHPMENHHTVQDLLFSLEP